MSTSAAERGNASKPAPRPDTPAPKQSHWPGLESPPNAPAKAAAARALFRRAVGRLDVRVVLPDGQVLGRGGADAPAMSIRDADAFFRRLGADGLIGFGESYMTGDWSSSDLARLLTVFAQQIAALIPAPLQAVRRLYDKAMPDGDDNTIDGSRSNIHRHYDLSNDLFSLFLDKYMQYSSAWYEPGDSLDDAQLRKLDAILDLARVGPDSHLLEIGTGWGALAIRAATDRGTRVTALTISEEQKKYADERIAEAGVSDRVQVLLQDYRETEGQYDAIASIEMIESVGGPYLPTYFSTLNRLVKPGGWIGLQAITMPHDRMRATWNSYTWLRKYIFPGGLLPSVRLIEELVRDHTDLRIVERRELGADYTRTAQEWGARFTANHDAVRALGFDETFIRMWDFYLAYCEAGFASGYISDFQFSLYREA